jgi:hypothetical protein
VSEFNETKATEFRRNYRKESRLNYRQIINLTCYRKTASAIVSGITKTVIFILLHNAMSKLDKNNKLLTKVYFPSAVLPTLCISTITVVLLCFCEVPVTSTDGKFVAHNLKVSLVAMFVNPG